MQCRKCGNEIPNGELFCVYCGEEVQLVPDYNSVEYMIQQKEAEENLRMIKEQELIKKQQRLEKKAAQQRKKKRKMIVLISFLSLSILVLAGLGTYYFLSYSRENSYEYQYGKGYEAYQMGDYAGASVYAERALELSPDNDNAILLTAEVRIHLGNAEGAIDLLKAYIQKHPESIDAYARLINIYEETEQTEQITLLMEECRNEYVLEQFAAYLPCDIAIVTPSGEYDSKITFEIEFSGGTVYYTTDGSIPDMNSDVYTEPVLLEEGTTVVNAVNYNQAGIPGELVTAEYTITLIPPNAPFISPESGEYESGEVITVIVPDGCKAYYSFDSVATSSDKLYTGPVTMPDGEHIFSVIAVDDNGKQSYPASETYVVN